MRVPESCGHANMQRCKQPEDLLQFIIDQINESLQSTVEPMMELVKGLCANLLQKWDDANILYLHLL